MINELELELAICNRLADLLPDLYGEGYRLASRQGILETNRLDIVLEAPGNRIVIIELKRGAPPAGVVDQLNRYLKFWRTSHPDHDVTGMVIGTRNAPTVAAALATAGLKFRVIGEADVLRALQDGIDVASIPAGVKYSAMDATGRIRFMLSDFSKITLPYKLELAAPWNHEKVFHALIQRGMRHKDPWKADTYVALYPQRERGNCALLYHPDSKKAVAAAPIHFNASGADWRADVFERLAPHLRFVQRDSEMKGSNAFDWYAVAGNSPDEIEQAWGAIARALSLDPR